MIPQILEGTWEDLVSRHNVDLAGHKVRVQVMDAPQPNASPISFEERERLLDTLAAGGERLPILPGTTFSREDIYEGRD